MSVELVVWRQRCRLDLQRREDRKDRDVWQVRGGDGSEFLRVAEQADGLAERVDRLVPERLEFPGIPNEDLFAKGALSRTTFS